MYRANGKSTAIVSGGRKKIHTTWLDGMEMVEEYDLTTDLLLHRRTRMRTKLGGEGKWQIEVGEDEKSSNQSAAIWTEGIAESNDNPIVIRKDTKDCFQWRIRNLPYPQEVYNITADPNARNVVVRTTNKKYFKRLDIPDMDRASLPLQEGAVTFSHANRTLLISYQKPPEILRAEEEWRQQRSKMKVNQEGDVECPQQ